MTERQGTSKRGERVTFTTLHRFITQGPPGVRREAVRDWLAIQWAQACEKRAIMLGDERGAGVVRQMIYGINAAMLERESDPFYVAAYTEFGNTYFPYFLAIAERAVRASDNGVLFTMMERRIWATNRVIDMYPRLAMNG